MPKITLEFTVHGQRISICDNYFIAEGAQNLVEAKFSTDSTWDSLTLYARFRQGEAPNGKPQAYDVLVDSDTLTCVIPHEVLKFNSFNVNLFGENKSGDKLTTQALLVRVRETINGETGEPDVPTPSILQQIIDMIEQGGVTANGSVVNLAPIFSVPFENAGYWNTVSSGYFTRLSDGWVHLEADNTSGSSDLYVNFFDNANSLNSVLTESTEYTSLIEVRNVTGLVGNPSIYFPSSISSGVKSLFSENAICNITSDEDLSETYSVTSSSSFDDSLVSTRGYVRVPIGAKVSMDFRCSLYAADYDGDYIPPVVIYDQKGTIYTDQIADGSVTSGKLADDSVTSTKIADNAVTSGALATDSVTQSKIAAASVGTSELIGSSVTAEKIANGAVTGSKLSETYMLLSNKNGNVQSNDDLNDYKTPGVYYYVSGTSGVQNLPPIDNSFNLIVSNVGDNTRIIQEVNPVGTNRLFRRYFANGEWLDYWIEIFTEETGNIIGDNLSDGAVRTSKISDDAVTTAKIADDAVTAEKIADDSVGAAAIASDIIVGNPASTGNWLMQNSSGALQTRIKSFTSSEDLNGYFLPGVIYVSGDSLPSNCPPSDKYSGWSYGFSIGSGDIWTQILSGTGNNPGIWVRNYIGSPRAWTEWRLTATDRSYTNNAGGFTVSVSGNVGVCQYVGVLDGAYGSATSSFTLPAWARPASNVSAPLVTQGATASGYLSARADGTFFATAWNAASTSERRGSVTWVITP